MMRLLVVYPYVPYPVTRGTFQRTFHLLRELAGMHQVDFFCLDENRAGEPYLDVFQKFCRRVKFHPFFHPPWPKLFPGRLLHPMPSTLRHWEDPDAHSSLRKFVAGQDYDLVYFCDLVMWPYVRKLPHRTPWVMDRSRVDLLFQTEELVTLRLGIKERLLRLENLWKLRRAEKQAAAELAATVVCGPDDERFSRARIRKDARMLVLPNGCDVSFFSMEKFPPAEPKAPTWLFCGAMDYTPNVDALLWYFESMDPLTVRSLPERRVMIVGRDPAPAIRSLASHRGVKVTGEVPDVRPYYQGAHFQIVPLRIGGGTRLKIVESLAIGCPVVSTTIGAQGLELEHGRHLLLADNPGDFANACTTLARDKDLREKLRKAGRERVLDLYGWPKLAKKLEEFLRVVAREAGEKSRK